MEEQPTLKRMMVQEARTRPDPQSSSRLIVTVCAYGTDHCQYRFEVALPAAVAEQVLPGEYITATLYSNRAVRSLVWAFKATDSRDMLAPTLRQVTIHDVRLNVVVSGLVGGFPDTYLVTVGGEPSEGNPYIVEFEAPLETARRIKSGGSADILIDSDDIARKIVIGAETIDVTHVGKA